MNKGDGEGGVLNTLRDEDDNQNHESSQLVGLPNISTKRTVQKWDDGEVTHDKAPIMHVDKRLKEALQDADEERHKEL